MGLVILVAAATLAYLKLTGQLTRQLTTRLALGALVLAALFALMKEAFLPAAALGLGALAWWRMAGKPAKPRLRADEARGVLGLAPGVDADTVRAAHRRLVAQLHPDRGGSADLTARVNAARDVLLAELRKPA